MKKKILFPDALKEASIHLELFACNPKYIKNEIKIREFISRLAKMMMERRYGDCAVIYLGSRKDLQGYSMIQLFQDGLLAGKFIDQSRSAHIDLVCTPCGDKENIATFCQRFFGAERYQMQCTDVAR